VECQQVLREDLRIVPMSATIDGERFAGLLGADVPVIESEGKAWPLEHRWLGAAPDKRTDEAMATAILTAWRERMAICWPSCPASARSSARVIA
jgi:ATP-dependent helicase HrpB